MINNVVSVERHSPENAKRQVVWVEGPKSGHVIRSLVVSHNRSILRLSNKKIIEWNDDWVGLSECSKECGGGTRVEKRTCPEEIDLCPGGIAASRRTVACNEQPCGK